MSTPYSTTIQLSTKNGPLAQVWLAANMSNISRGSILQTNIAETVDEIAKISGLKNANINLDDQNESISNITLRTSGELLQGIVRVYSKQATFLLSDIKDALIKISSLFKTNQRISMTLSKENTIAKIDQLFLQDQVTENEVLNTPGLEFLNETSIPDGLNANNNLINRNDSMQRKVTGAALDNNLNNNNNAPWDTSIEIGRRYNPDGDLENYHSSALDLEFDLHDEQPYPRGTYDNDNMNSKSLSWVEGTGSNFSQNSKNKNELGQASDTIHDSDFPNDVENAGTNDEVDWDLGIIEGNDNSVEIGRRASTVAEMEQPTDFGFDLDLGKDPIAEQEIQEEELNLSRLDNSNIVDKIKVQKPLKNVELINAKKLIEDVEIELRDEVVKRDKNEEIATSSALAKGDSSDGFVVRVSEKRLMDDITQSLNHLQPSIIKNYIQFDSFKRLKTRQTVTGNIEMNLSFAEDDIVAGSGVENSDLEIDDANLSDHLLPLEAEISYPQSENSSFNDVVSVDSNDDKVKLSSGEYVSKHTAEMAHLLRNQFIDHEELSFDVVLEADHKENNKDSSLPITKSEASKNFFEMLSLATVGCIDLNQNESFGDIQIMSKTLLYEKFVEA